MAIEKRCCFSVAKVLILHFYEFWLFDGAFDFIDRNIVSIGVYESIDKSAFNNSLKGSHCQTALGRYFIYDALHYIFGDIADTNTIFEASLNNLFCEYLDFSLIAQGLIFNKTMETASDFRKSTAFNKLTSSAFGSPVYALRNILFSDCFRLFLCVCNLNSAIVVGYFLYVVGDRKTNRPLLFFGIISGQYIVTRKEKDTVLEIILATTIR